MIETEVRQTIRITLKPTAEPDAGSGAISRNGRIIALGLWALCLALVMRLTVFHRQRSLENYAVIDKYAVLQILIVVCSLLVVVLSGRAGSMWRKNARNASGLIFSFYFFGALSSLWSPAPAFSFYRALEALSQIAAIHVALSYAPGMFAAERRVLGVSLISMAMGMASTIIDFGPKVSLSAWHTNQYTVPAMLVFTYAFGEILAGRQHERFFLGISGLIGLLGMVLGTSTGSFISMFGGIFVALLMTRFRGRKLLALSVLFAIVILLVGTASLKRLVFYGKTQQSVEQLSGRMYIWKGYLKDLRDRPFFGQGFAISARISSHYKTTNTHNSALSVLLGTGLAGMALVLLGLKRFTRDAVASARRAGPGAVGCVAAISAGLLNSMTVAFLGETWMMSSMSVFAFLAFFSLFIVSSNGLGSGGRLVLRPKSRVVRD